MGTAYNPSIVTDGLVLCLDAGNTKSYIGSGTAWNDLSGNNNNGTLTNGPIYGASGGGSIRFDGTNDYVNCGRASSLAIANNLTCSFWIWFPTGYGNTNAWNSAVTKRNIFAAGANKGTFIFNYLPSSNWFQLSFFVNTTTERNLRLTLNTIFSVNTWTHVTGVWQQSSTNTIITCYKNSVQVGTGTYAGNVPSHTDIDVCVAGLTDGVSEPGNCTIAQVQLYNRVLTDAEIQQNFNATRSRYGV